MTALALPNGFHEDGTPVSISFIGDLPGEAEMLTVGKAYLEATGFYLRHPRSLLYSRPRCRAETGAA